MPSTNLNPLNQITALTLLALSLTGLWGTWGIGGRTGFLALIKSSLDAPSQVLPVVNQPIKHTYTFIPPIDALIRRLNVFLWPAIDGTWPGLCLVAWEFSGQFSATWMVAGVEGMRVGNRGKIISYTTIIGLLSQTITYGTILPFYLFLHVLTSDTNLGLHTTTTTSNNNIAESFLVDPADLAAWAPAFTLSYLLPTLLVCLPSPKFTSFSTRQVIMAVWELYPVPFKLFQVLLARYLFSTSSPITSLKQSGKATKSQTLVTLRKTYLYAALVSAFSHTMTNTLTFSTLFFPTLFDPSSRSSLSPSNVLLPTTPWYSTPAKNLGEGLWVFLGWNMGVSNIAPLVWGVLQWRNAVGAVGRATAWEEDEGGWVVVLAKVVGLSVAAGPGTGVAYCLWKRDEVVLGEGGGSQRKVK